MIPLKAVTELFIEEERSISWKGFRASERVYVFRN